jgi:tRNA 2-thiouridine synthesizing protein C
MAVTPGIVKKFLFVNRKAPHGTIYALEALEVVLAAAAFEQAVSLAFLDDGVYQLARGQEAAGIGRKTFAPAYRALKDYDIEKIYVEQESLVARGLSAEELLVPVTLLTQPQMAELMESQDVVLSF